MILLCFRNREGSLLLVDQKWTPSKWSALCHTTTYQIAIIKTEVHTRKIEPEFQGHVLADFHAKSASTKIVPICNMNKFPKSDSSQIISNLYIKTKFGTWAETRVQI